jgi:HPt (histidine-containing phosphotransfer) domain-containing protein
MSVPVRLDHAAIETLAGMSMSGAPDLLAIVISMFLESTPAFLDTLRRSAASGDLQTLQRVSHDLKSSSATLGARLMAIRCARLEAIGRAGLASETISLVAEIVMEFNAVRPMLVALLPASTPTVSPLGVPTSRSNPVQATE